MYQSVHHYFQSNPIDLDVAQNATGGDLFAIGYLKAVSKADIIDFDVHDAIDHISYYFGTEKSVLLDWYDSQY